RHSDDGAVHVLYGSPEGLSSAGSQFWSQDSPGILDAGEGGDEFGYAVTTADFNLDGILDVAVGVSGEGVGIAHGSGAVSVLFGSQQGLTALGNEIWSQESPGILDRSEPYDFFGASLVAADFGKGAGADLAVGVPFERLGDSPYAGAGNALYGSPTGLSSAGNQLWNENSTRIEDAADA